MLGKILDINQAALNNIRFAKGKNNTYILTNEILPTEEEFRRLKSEVIKKYNLHNKDEINIAKFNKIHKKYGGIVPDYMFADRILDISKKEFTKIKNHDEEKTQILLNTHMSEKELEQLKKKVIEENNLYVAKPITLEEFYDLFNKYEHILSEIDFAKKILGVNRQNLNKLKKHDCETIYIYIGVEKGQKREKIMPLTEFELEKLKKCLINGLLDEEIATTFFVTLPFIRKNISKVMKKENMHEEDILFARVKRLRENGKKQKQIMEITGSSDNQIKQIIERIKEEENRKTTEEKRKEKSCKNRKKDKKALKRKVAKILGSYEENSKNSSLIRQYIDFCREEFKEKEFPKEELDVLGECIEFLLGGAEDIKFFSKVCISFGEYRRANAFISNNMNNPEVSNEEKKNLIALHKNIVYAIRKQKAVDLFYYGKTDPKEVAELAGIFETDAIIIKKNLIDKNKKLKTIGIIKE